MAHDIPNLTMAHPHVPMTCPGSSPDFLSCSQLGLTLQSECLGPSGLPGSQSQLTLLCLLALPSTQMWLLECIFAAGDVSTFLLIFGGSHRLLGLL